MTQPQEKTQPAEQSPPVEPGHVMAREHYERLAREAAQEK